MSSHYRLPVTMNNNQVGSVYVHDDGDMELVLGHRMSSALELFKQIENDDVESIALVPKVRDRTDPKTEIEKG